MKKQIRIARVKDRDGCNVYQLQYRHFWAGADPKPWKHYKEVRNCDSLEELKEATVEELRFMYLSFPYQYADIELINTPEMYFDKAFLVKLRDATVRKFYSKTK